MPELGSTSRKAGTSTSEKMNESMPSMVHPPQAAQNARFWLDVSGTLAAGVSTTGLCMRGAGKKLDHRWAKKSRRVETASVFQRRRSTHVRVEVSTASMPATEPQCVPRKHRFLWSRLGIGTPRSQRLTEP